MKIKLTAVFLCLSVLLSVFPIVTAQAASEDSLSVVGVQLRMEGTQALRFIGRISTAFADELRAIDSSFGKPDSYLRSTGYGFVVTGLPLPADTPLRKDTERALVVPAVMTFDENDDETFFTACITGISPLRYTTVFTAVPYATYRDAEGGETTVYGEEYAASVADVASVAFLSAGDEEKTVFASLLNAIPAVRADYAGKALAGKMNEEALRFAYDRLSEALEKREESVTLTDDLHQITTDEAYSLFRIYRADHPEAIALTNTYTSYVGDDVLLDPDYFDDYSAARQKAFDLAAAALYAESGIRSSMSDYEKSLRLHDAIVYNAEYDYSFTAPHAYDAYGAIVDGLAVCDGYAKAYQYLMRMAGIECDHVNGYSYTEWSDEPVGHAWTCSKLDGDWYYQDVTWDDQGDEPYYAYLNVTTEILFEDHIPSRDDYAFPICTATKDNYFVREGGLMTAEGDLDYVIAALKEGGFARIFVTGDEPWNIWNWYGSHLMDIASELGHYGSFSYSYKAVGREYHLFFNRIE